MGAAAQRPPRWPPPPKEKIIKNKKIKKNNPDPLPPGHTVGLGGVRMGTGLTSVDTHVRARRGWVPARWLPPVRGCSLGGAPWVPMVSWSHLCLSGRGNHDNRLPRPPPAPGGMGKGWRTSTEPSGKGKGTLLVCFPHRGNQSPTRSSSPPARCCGAHRTPMGLPYK